MTASHPDKPAHAGADVGGVPIAPALDDTLAAARIPRKTILVDKRVVLISAISVVLAVAAAFIAQFLKALIGLVTNLSFYGHWSIAFSSPAGNHLGPWVIAVPVLGGIVVMAQFIRFAHRIEPFTARA